MVCFQHYSPKIIINSLKFSINIYIFVPAQQAHLLSQSVGRLASPNLRMKTWPFLGELISFGLVFCVAIKFDSVLRNAICQTYLKMANTSRLKHYRRFYSFIRVGRCFFSLLVLMKLPSNFACVKWPIKVMIPTFENSNDDDSQCD